MPDDALLLVGTSGRTPEIRHEVALDVPDAIIWLAHDGGTVAWATAVDLEPLRAGGALEDVRDAEELGYQALRRQPPLEMVFAEMTRRALEAHGIRRVRVPFEFALGIADHLRAAGIDVGTDAEAFAARRRSKREWELDGMRAAGAAAQAALLEAARLLREHVDGLTCER